jgi:hypothetical protein
MPVFDFHAQIKFMAGKGFLNKCPGSLKSLYLKLAQKIARMWNKLQETRQQASEKLSGAT